MTDEQLRELFESGWADFRADHLDLQLFKESPFYRGGWLSASADNLAQKLQRG